MRWIRVLLLCLLVASCGSRAPRGLWADPSLDSSSLAEGVVIGGVTDLTAERDVYDMQQDSRILEEALVAGRPSVPVTEWAQARSVIGPDTLDGILAAYRLTGRLGAGQLASLSPLASEGRYLVLSRIDLDQTLYEYTRRVREMSDRTLVDLDPESRRKISLIVDLYDLQSMRLVYTIPLERTGIEHGSVYTVEGVESVPTESEVRNAIQDLAESNDRPEPADRGGLLASMFKEAVKHLP
jgi:hypothetical protein